LGLMTMLRLMFALLPAAVPVLAMADDIFLQSQSPTSERYAVLEDDGKIAFLYLAEPTRPTPVRDAVVYTRIAPGEKVDWDLIQNTGAPPRLEKRIASPTAITSSPKAMDFMFKWSADGESVVVLHKGVPLAFVSMKHRFGFSKAVMATSPVRNPWDQKLYITLFSE